MDIGIVLSIWTIIVMIVFIGIVIWAWSSKRKREFDEAANIPFKEDNDSEQAQV